MASCITTPFLLTPIPSQLLFIFYKMNSPGRKSFFKCAANVNGLGCYLPFKAGFVPEHLRRKYLPDDQRVWFTLDIPVYTFCLVLLSSVLI